MRYSKDVTEKTIDPASQEMIRKAEKENIETIWNRLEKQRPQCGFGMLGTCCKNCMQGPCRIDPFQEGATHGVCGANADTIVARNLVRHIAAGTAAHAGHAKRLAHTLLKSAEGKTPDYSIKDEAKLMAVAKRIGINPKGKSKKDLATEVAIAALSEFSEKETPLTWTTTTVNRERVETFLKLDVVPTGIDAAVSEIMHRTHYGVDSDPVNLLLAGIKCSLADYAGCHMGTDLADILFGTPSPIVSRANLGILNENAVNIAFCGHDPVLSEVIVQVSLAMNQEAKKAGASEGLNLVSICCTGNEALMRYGIPSATHGISQELAIVTGVLDAMIVDYQYIMPSLATVAECYHTNLITTIPIAKTPGATHIEFKTKESARDTIRLGIESFKRRNSEKINIPSYESSVLTGLSSEAIIGALSKVNEEDPLKPLINNIVNGNIYGVCLFAGCSNVKVTQDIGFIEMAKELTKNNVMILATGCGAGSFARHGFLSSDSTNEYTGEGLKPILTALGQAVSLSGPLPPVFHMGSCVDNSRAVDVIVAVAKKLGVDTCKLPVVVSIPEATSETAISMGTWTVSLGLPTHIGVVPPILGGPLVTRILTQDLKSLFGGFFIFEADPKKAAQNLLKTIRERRKGLGLST